MQRRILASLGIDDAQVFVRDVDRPNISLLRWQVSPNDRPQIIAKLCQLRLPPMGKVMIFVPTRKIGEALQGSLRHQGLETPFYHSQLGSGWQREQLLKRFVGESLPTVDRIICTSAFGMGLDVSNVRMVIHWQHPSSVEDYLQEFGRAGRDGKPSVAVLLHAGQRNRKDIGLLNFMAERTVESARLDMPTRAEAIAHKTKQIQAMDRIVRQDGCFRRELVSYFSGSRRNARRSLSMWLLEWGFADRGIAKEKAMCCDACAQRMIKRKGELRHIQSILTGGA
jgi:superfamily II DNA helicase RecQ